jgi:hypothetical protein
VPLLKANGARKYWNKPTTFNIKLKKVIGEITGKVILRKTAQR